MGWGSAGWPGWLATTPNNCRNAHGCAGASRLLSTVQPVRAAQPPAGERRVVPGEAAEPGKPRKSRSRRSSRSEAAGRTGELASRVPVDLGRIFETIHASATDEFRIAVRRPDDLLVFDLVFGNLRLAENGPARLMRRDPGSSAFVVAEFPPQSFGEEAFLEVSGSTYPDDT